MSKHYEVIVLGSGNAGLAAAGVAKAAGKSVAVVESWDVGGTCAIRGCVPKKVLVAAAQALHQIALAPEHHIAVGEFLRRRRYVVLLSAQVFVVVTRGADDEDAVRPSELRE